MDDFLVLAYIVSTSIALITIFLLSPISLNFLLKYIGWSPTLIFAIGCLVWCVTFVMIGSIFKPDPPKKG